MWLPTQPIRSKASVHSDTDNYRVKMKARTVAQVHMAVCLVLGIPAVTSAQRSTEAEDAKLRADCRLATQVLTTGNPARKEEWAWKTITRCEESAGAVLATLWADAPADTAELDRLYVASDRRRDRRVLETLIEVARTRESAQLVRLGALRVLAAYTDPRLVVDWEHLLQPGAETGRRVLLSTRTDVVTFDGIEPLPPDTEDRVLAALRQLAASDPDPVIRTAAGFLSESLESRLRR